MHSPATSAGGTTGPFRRSEAGRAPEVFSFIKKKNEARTQRSQTKQDKYEIRKDVRSENNTQNKHKASCPRAGAAQRSTGTERPRAVHRNCYAAGLGTNKQKYEASPSPSPSPSRGF